MKTIINWISAALVISLTLDSAASLANEQHASASRVDADGTIHVLAFDLPQSGFLSAETRAALVRQAKEFKQLEECAAGLTAPNDAAELQLCAQKYYYGLIIPRQRSRYKVAIQPQMMGGVATEIITPVEGISSENRQRILVSLPGGGLVGSGRLGGELLSMPIAAVGKIKVVSVTYRYAPNSFPAFPAATEDVAAVYGELLKGYKPENIGIYGCSAGGILTARSIAWFQKQKMPLPGAVGILCGGAFSFAGNDSYHIIFRGVQRLDPSLLEDSNSNDPLAYPGLDPAVMAKFPASLLITSTRDAAMSPALATHTLLVKLGVKADLHVWEGMEHGFLIEPDFTESRDAYDVIARFFSKNLGRGGGEN